MALEPQNYKECNLIRLVSEAVNYVKKVNRPEIRAMADFYHMEMENEPLELLKDVGPWLAHVQLADTDRKNPGTGSYPYDAFMRYLKEGGYKGNLSVECMVEIPESEMRRSLAFLRDKSQIFSKSDAATPRAFPALARHHEHGSATSGDSNEGASMLAADPRTGEVRELVRLPKPTCRPSGNGAAACP